MRSLCTRCRIGDSAVITRMPQLRTRLFEMLWFAALLIIFAGCLERCRFAGGIEYDGLATDYTRLFHARWVERHQRSDLLGRADIQALADLESSCEVVQRTRIVPFSPIADAGGGEDDATTLTTPWFTARNPARDYMPSAVSAGRRRKRHRPRRFRSPRCRCTRPTPCGNRTGPNTDSLLHILAPRAGARASSNRRCRSPSRPCNCPQVRKRSGRCR